MVKPADRRLPAFPDSGAQPARAAAHGARRLWAPGTRARALTLTAHWPVAVAVAAVIFPIYLSTLAPGLTWAHAGADGGDLITAAATQGVAHPTGYPTYLLLARLFQWLPVGSLAFRTNLLSAVCAALAAGIVAALVSRGYGGRRRFGLAGGLLAGIGFGLSPLLWSQAVITEVYALHALLVALILATLPGFGGTPASARADVGAGVLVGVALGNHLTTALLLPAWLIASGWWAGRIRPGALLWRLAGLGLGLLVYLVLPLNARAQPPVNWGGASDWSGLWWLISAAPYRALVFGLPAGDWLARLQAWAAMLVGQFGWPGLLLALYGLFYGASKRAQVKGVTVWVVVVGTMFAIGYAAADSYAYLLPVFLVVAIWFGLGAATALERIPPFRGRNRCRLLLAAATGALLLLNAGHTLPAADASGSDEAETFGRGVMAGAPAQALILTHGDADTFALWYFHFALHERIDVAVVAEPLLDFAWYRDSLRAAYPRLTIPARPAGGWGEALIAANGNRPVCDTQTGVGEHLRCRDWPPRG